MKAQWYPGKRVQVRLPLPGWAVAFAIGAGMVPIVATLAAGFGMSSSQIDSGLWVPGLLLALALGTRARAE